MAAHAHSAHQTNELPDVTHIRNEDVHHEVSDINVRAIVKFLLWFFGTSIVIHFLMYGLFEWFEHDAEKDDPKPSKIARTFEERLPPEPRLQLAPGHPEHPLAEGARFKQEQLHAVTSTGWVDQQQGIVHIPIEDAKQRLLQQGFPTVGSTTMASSDTTQKPGTAPTSATKTSQRDPGIAAPSPSSSGRLLEWRDRW